MKEIALATMDDAQEVLTALKALRTENGFATVSELYDLVGIPTTYKDAYEGWQNLAIARVEPVGNSYALFLPPTMSFKHE
jgi:hypothetical protein